MLWDPVWRFLAGVFYQLVLISGLWEVARGQLWDVTNVSGETVGTFCAQEDALAS